LMLVARMRSIACTGHKKTLPQIALRWLLDKHEVTSVITGAKDSRQIDENVGALGWRLSEADAGQLEMCAETASL
jgi:aryl-alcohol dehydrogenase-like predicted oxidoreductase